jgi:hypothetical protein
MCDGRHPSRRNRGQRHLWQLQAHGSYPQLRKRSRATISSLTCHANAVSRLLLQVPDGFKGLIMLCIRRAPEDRPSLSKIRRLLHRITISFIDQQKREIDREIEREFSSLFEEAPRIASPTPHTHMPPLPPPAVCTPRLSFEDGRGRLLVVTDEMREEQEPATMCARCHFCWFCCCCLGRF